MALEERDVKKYAYYLVPYNLGVISTGAAIEVMMYSRFDSAIQARLAQYFGVFSRWVSLLIWLVAAFIFLRIWICDVCWLFFARKESFERWLKELEDEHNPVLDHTWLMRMFYLLRRELGG